MFNIFLSYAVSDQVLDLMYLLFLIPAVMPMIAFVIIKRSKAAIDKRFAYDDEMARRRQQEIAEEKALDDDYGTSWHIHGQDK